MKYHVDEWQRLVLTISKQEQRELLRLKQSHDEFDCDSTTKAVLCWLAESVYSDFAGPPDDRAFPLRWASASDFGDLTDAPMLALVREGKTVARWGFMDYQVESVLGRLLDLRECVWLGGIILDTTNLPAGVGYGPLNLSGEVDLAIFPEKED